MGNKLKDLFAEEPDELTGIIHFANRDSFQKFVDKMDEVYVDGKPARVDGIESIQLNMNDGNNQYPIEEQKNIKHVIVYPYQEEINIPINTSITLTIPGKGTNGYSGNYNGTDFTENYTTTITNTGG